LHHDHGTSARDRCHGFRGPNPFTHALRMGPAFKPCTLQSISSAAMPLTHTGHISAATARQRPYRPIGSTSCTAPAAAQIESARRKPFRRGRRKTNAATRLQRVPTPLLRAQQYHKQRLTRCAGLPSVSLADEIVCRSIEVL
jgi:hypothetical protein